MTTGSRGTPGTAGASRAGENAESSRATTPSGAAPPVTPGARAGAERGAATGRAARAARRPPPRALRRAGARGTAAVLTVTLTAGLVTALTACDDTRERAVDCAKLAIEVSRAVDELERVALTAALDEDPDQFTGAVRDDTQRVVNRTSNVEVERAADSVMAAVDNVHEAVVAGTDPDLAPLSDAVGELTRVCDPTTSDA